MTQQRTSTRSRRRSILLAALERFSAADIDSVSIAQICERSGASVGSIYHHFGNKEGIVMALLADGLHAHLELLDSALEKAGNEPRRCVEAVIGCLFDWVESNQQWAAFIYAHLNRSGARSEEPIIAINKRYEAIIQRSFGALIASGQLRKLPDECWSSLILAPTHDYARRWLGKRNRPPIDAVRDIFIDAAWRVLQPATSDVALTS